MSATSSLAFLLRRMAPLALTGALAACSDDPMGLVPIGGPPLVAAPTITKQPSSLSVAAGATANFEVAATGSGPLDYQWRRGGTAIAGATSAKLTLAAVAASDDETKLSVVVSNTAGTATSADAVLNVTTSIPGDPPYPTLCTGPQSTGWCWVTPSTGTKVTFADASTGLLANGPLIFRTADGGVHWYLATVNTTAVTLIRDVRFATPTIAVAVGDTVGNAAITLRSTDGGASWSEVASGTPSSLFGVSFGSANVGAAVGSGGEIAYTTNGGQTWAPAASGTTAPLYSVTFGSDTIGVAVGGLGTIVRTTDGGMTWTPVAASGNSYESVTFASATTAFAVNGDGIRRSDDVGLTWTLLAGTPGLHDIHFGDPLHGVAVGPAATSVQSSDGGATWTPLVGAQSNLRAVAFAGKSAVVVLGQAIQRSLDAGRTWGPTSPTTQVALPAINALRYADPLTAVAVGGDAGLGALITRTADGGATWTGVPSPTDDPLVGIDFASPTIGAAVGAGVILRTVNAGVTWTVVSSDPSRRLFGVRFAGPKVGVAVGRQGLVLRTDDAGATWNPIAALGSISLTAITFGSATVGLIGDDGGGILRTTDAGLTWSPAVAGPGSTVNSMDFADATTVIAVGNYSNLRRSSDGGVTWTTVVAVDLQAPQANAVRFATPSLGYVVGAKGVIKRTVDGGVTWTQPFPHLPVPFGAIDFSGPKNGLIGGQFSNILRTTTAGQ